MSDTYYDGLEDMLADQRDYDRELAWERLELLERADTLAPLGLTSSPAAAGVGAGEIAPKSSPAVRRPSSSPPSPAGHSMTPGRAGGTSDERTAA